MKDEWSRGELYSVLVWKPEEERPRCRWENNIKMDLQAVELRTWTGLIWLRIGTGGGLL